VHGGAWQGAHVSTCLISAMPPNTIARFAARVPTTVISSIRQSWSLHGRRLIFPPKVPEQLDEAGVR
jgi:hypothetical protein